MLLRGRQFLFRRHRQGDGGGLPRQSVSLDIRHGVHSGRLRRTQLRVAVIRVTLCRASSTLHIETRAVLTLQI